MLQINPLLCLQGSSGSLLQAHARTPRAFAQHSQWGACHLSAPLPLCSVRALSSAGAVFPPPHMPSLNCRPHSGLCQCPPCICFPQLVRGKASLRPLCVLTERPHPSLPCTTVTCVPTFPLEAIHAPGGPGSSRLYPCIAACSDLPCTEGFLKLLLNRAKGGI